MIQSSNRGINPSSEEMTCFVGFRGCQQHHIIILITHSQTKAFAPPCGSYMICTKVHKHLNMTFTLGRSIYVVEG